MAKKLNDYQEEFIDSVIEFGKMGRGTLSHSNLDIEDPESVNQDIIEWTEELKKVETKLQAYRDFANK